MPINKSLWKERLSNQKKKVRDGEKKIIIAMEKLELEKNKVDIYKAVLKVGHAAPLLLRYRIYFSDTEYEGMNINLTSFDKFVKGKYKSIKENEAINILESKKETVVVKVDVYIEIDDDEEERGNKFFRAGAFLKDVYENEDIFLTSFFKPS